MKSKLLTPRSFSGSRVSSLSGPTFQSVASGLLPANWLPHNWSRLEARTPRPAVGDTDRRGVFPNGGNNR